MENNDLFELADGGKTLVRCKAERVRDCAVPAGVETIVPEAFAAADVGTSPLAGIDSGFMHV